MLRKLFKVDAELEQRVAELSDLRDTLIGERDSLRKRQEQSELYIQSLNSQLDMLRSKVREQTDADLLLVSARIAIAVLRGEKPAEADVLWQNALQQQKMSIANAGYGNGLAGSVAGAFGLYGLGGLFGNRH